MNAKNPASGHPIASWRPGLARLAGGVLLLLTFALLGGCAPINVQQVSESAATVPRPDRTLVYDFAVSPEEVKLDTGLSAELMDRYKHLESGSAP